jgi:hypothetical protein
MENDGFVDEFVTSGGGVGQNSYGDDEFEKSGDAGGAGFGDGGGGADGACRK